VPSLALTSRHGPYEHARLAAPASTLEVLRTPGQALDVETRAEMEARFGHDFGHVRVHADAKAAASAWTVNALAYTVGRDVAFASGQYRPRTRRGRELLAHELSHVVQQEARAAQPAAVPVIARGTGEHEREARAAAARVSAGSHAAVTPGSAPLALQRQPRSPEAVEEGEKPAVAAISLSPRTIPDVELTAQTGLPDKSATARGARDEAEASGPTVGASVKATAKPGEAPEVTTNVELVIPIGLGGIPGTPIVVGKSASVEVAMGPYSDDSGYRKVAIDASVKALVLELESRRAGVLEAAAKAGLSHEYESRPASGGQAAKAGGKTSFKAAVEAKYKPPVKVAGVQPYLFASVGFKVKPKDTGVEVKPTSDLEVGPAVTGGVGLAF
jgi:hypothetical protein